MFPRRVILAGFLTVISRVSAHLDLSAGLQGQSQQVGSLHLIPGLAQQENSPFSKFKAFAQGVS
jgi:hypothetical protein